MPTLYRFLALIECVLRPVVAYLLLPFISGIESLLPLLKFDTGRFVMPVRSHRRDTSEKWLPSVQHGR